MLYDVRMLVNHWYTLPNQKSYRANKRWGRFLLWLANVGGRHSHHQLQGSLAAASGLRELTQILAMCVGVPLEEIWKRPFSSNSLAACSMAEGSGQMVRGYLAKFYEPCDRVFNLEGEAGSNDLQSLGVPRSKVVNIDLTANVGQQIFETYRSIVDDSISRISPKRTKLSDFEWGPALPGYESTSSSLAMSDLHLGDGSGTERAQATIALKPHVERLNIDCIDIVGDLIQRDVPKVVSARHRETFLSALQHLSGSTSRNEKSIISVKVEVDSSVLANSKRMLEVQKELQTFAFKIGGRIELGDMTLGIPNDAPQNSIPVYMERGNHDEGERLEEVIPGAKLAPSMIRLDKSSGVLFCHGNIWNLPEVPLALK